MSQSGKLRVVHVAEDISAIAGGVPEVVRQLSQRLSIQGMSVQIVHALGDSSGLAEGVESLSFPSTGLGRTWSWAIGLRKGIKQLATLQQGDIPPLFHLHGIWAAPQYFAARTAQESGIPFVITAHGMLDPWLWRQQGWRVYAKKHIYWKMLAYPALRAASMVHAITPMEQQYLRTLFPSSRIEVIPNAIDLDGLSEMGLIREERQRLILFLGRVEPKKGVDILLHAFAKANIGRDWRVAIVGPVWSRPYQFELERIVAENNLDGRVIFVGPVFGEEKIRWIRKAWVMAVPSHSEVVGLVNLEAAAYQLPTITTYQTGLYDWESGGGMLITPNVVDLQLALEQACSWDDAERDGRGLASQKLVAERYSWKAVMPLWMSLYGSLNKGVNV